MQYAHPTSMVRSITLVALVVTLVGCSNSGSTVSNSPEASSNPNLVDNQNNNEASTLEETNTNMPAAADGTVDSSLPIAENSSEADEELAEAETNSSVESTTQSTTLSIAPSQPPAATLELIPDKTYRFSWQQVPNADFYRVLENKDGVSGYVAIAENLNLNQSPFDHRVPLFRRHQAQYIVQACNEVGCVDSNTLVPVNALELASGYFKSNDASPGSFFGHEVRLSADGLTMAISAPRKLIDGVDPATGRVLADAGAVYIYSFESGQWNETAKLTDTDAARFDKFGHWIDLSADGKTLAVISSNSPLLHVFVEVNGEWQEFQRLNLLDYTMAEGCRRGVNLNESANIMVVRGDNAVCVFVRESETWELHSRITNDNLEFDDRVSFNRTGTMLAISAASEDAIIINGETRTLLRNAGAVYVYNLINDKWVEQHYITQNPRVTGAIFGNGIRFSSVDDTLLISARESTGFYKLMDGVWQLNETIPYGLGSNLDLSADGSVLTGKILQEVTVFEKDFGVWQEKTRLPIATRAGGATSHMSSNGNTIAIGFSSEDSASSGMNGARDNISTPGDYGAVFLY